ncbi:MAG TPA: HmuY family protein [Bacteroidales bacterium]|nr:HmuY family protein [Bacteroidales bacterium]
MKYVIPLILILLLTGCFPKDKMVTPRNIEIVEIPYSIYENQVWFNLSNKSIVSSNSYLDWDLGFESDGTGHHIILNSAKFMHAGNTQSTDFYGITSNVCDTMTFDSSDGDLNKTAIGDWADFKDPSNPVFPGNVYIIDLGSDNSGNPFGLKKVVFESCTDTTYNIHYSNLDGTDEHEYKVSDLVGRKFSLFSFSDGGFTSPLQPEDKDWDICFTQYSSILFDNNGVATPYLVRGVFLNPAGTYAAADSVNSYYNTGFSDIGSYTLSGKQDAIGYDWKVYANDTYSIRQELFYIIKDQKGEYYKLKFTGYYNSTGARGYPSFQLDNLSGSTNP